VHCHTVHESLALLFSDDGLFEEADRFWQQMDYEPFTSLLSLQPGLIECLEALRPQYRTAIATSRTRTLEPVLRRFGLNGYFDMVVTSNDVRNPKPHPESLQKILSFFNLTPLEACYIGDSGVDREASQRAGVLFFAFGNEGLEAAYRLNHFAELIPLLARLAPLSGKKNAR
jgi:HAD superfamily hydrolase (TIGR01509 family)